LKNQPSKCQSELNQPKIFFHFKNEEEMATKVEAPITNRLIDSTSHLEKYKAMQSFPCRKIEIKRIVNYSVILILKLK
jgi:hypothetical protein